MGFECWNKDAKHNSKVSAYTIGVCISIFFKLVIHI